MPLRPIHVDLALLAHENGVHLAVPLRYPEISALGRDPAALADQVARLARKVVRDLDPVDIHRRQPQRLPEIRQAHIRLEPSVPQEGVAVRSAWTEAVELAFHYVVWDHHNEAAVAYVPLLDLAVVAGDAGELPARVEREILYALRRANHVTSLGQLSRLQRIAELSVACVGFEAEVRTPKQRALGEDERTRKSAIAEVATDLRLVDHPPVFERDSQVESLAELLAGRTARSVLLVGPSGVGKTALVHEVCRRRGDYGLGRTPFWTTSGARIVAGMCGYGMWQKRCQEICREAAKTKAILHVGNLMELLQVGRSAGSDEGVADFLRPFVERGELLAVAECTDEQRAILERDAPGLVSAMAVIQVEPPTAKANRVILHKTATVWAGRRRVRLGAGALKSLDRLHQRYCTYSALPGRPLRFLRNLIESSPRGAVVTAADVTAAFSRETGLPHVLLDEREALDVESVRRWFGERVVGQAAAVDVVADLLAAVKASLTQPQRPIASLLFIGPTGVGKTEMARSLAEFLYRDRRRMVRIDMSEYADTLSIDRLIGGLFGTEGVLTAKVREQPFGVVLLDEFEKAHARFFDLLLQVLGEGRLTDAAGRLADFRNAVIIMTSNLGSESFGRGKIGLEASHLKAPAAIDHFRRAVQETVRPELFNRIDRIVPFLPLEKDTLLEIARRKIHQLQRREGIRFRSLTAAFGASVAEEIVRLGYDPRYGARPLDRVIDRQVLAPLAAALNEYQGHTALEASGDCEQGQIRVRVRAASGGDVSAELRGGLAPGPAAMAVELRREAVSLLDCRAVCDIRTELERIRAAEMRRRKMAARLSAASRTLPPPDPAILERTRLLEDLLARVEQVAADIVRIEQRILVDLYQERSNGPGGNTGELIAKQEQLDRLYLELFHRSLPEPDRITVALYSPTPRSSYELAGAYLAIARDRGCRVRVWRIVRGPVAGVDSGRLVRLEARDSDAAARGAATTGAPLEAIRLDSPEEFLAAAPVEDFGIALELEGYLAYPLLAAEAGRHRFIDAQGTADSIADTSAGAMADHHPPARIHMRATMNAQPLRRVYDAKQQKIEDRALGKSQYWKGKQVARVVGPWLEEQLRTMAKDWVHAC